MGLSSAVHQLHDSGPLTDLSVNKFPISKIVLTIIGFIKVLRRTTVIMEEKVVCKFQSVAYQSRIGVIAFVSSPFSVPGVPGQDEV